MKLAFLLLVVFLGNVLADEEQVVNDTNRARLTNKSKPNVSLVENPSSNAMNSVVVYKRYAQEQVAHKPKGKTKTLNKHKGNYRVNKLIKSINKEAAQKRKQITMLRKKAKSELFKLAKISRNNILTLTKMDKQMFNTLKQKALASQEITTGSIQMILNLVNVTVDKQRQILQRSAENIRVLSKSFIEIVKTYADSSMAKIYDALKRKDVEEAKNVLQNKLKMILKVSGTSCYKVRLMYSVSAKGTMDLANSASVLILDTATKRIQHFEGLRSENIHMKRYILFAIKTIYNLARTSGNKFVYLALYRLKTLKLLAYNSEKSLRHLGLFELELGKALIKNNVERRNAIKKHIDHVLSKFEDESTNDSKKFMDSITKETNSVMLEAAKKVEAILHLQTLHAHKSMANRRTNVYRVHKM